MKRIAPRRAGPAVAKRPRVAPVRPAPVAAVTPDEAPPLAALRRRQILDAAEECFRRHGFHNASMAEIARSFGMSAGHIYNYFDSKEAIIAAIVERDLADFMQRAARLRAAPDVRAALLARIDERVAEQLNPGKAARQLEVLAEGGRNPAVTGMLRAADAAVRAELREILRRARADGHGGRDLDGKVAVLMALFDGLLVRGLRQPDLPRPQLTRVLRAVMTELMR